MVEDVEREILARIRTLLALERNYLAEERTALAEFRTGLALTVIGPTTSTVLAYVFSGLPVERATLFDLLNVAFFSTLTVFGIWTSFRSRSKLKIIKEKKKIIKHREVAMIKSSEAIHDLLRDCIDVHEETKEHELHGF